MTKNQRLWDTSFLSSEEYMPVQRLLDMPSGQRALLRLGSANRFEEIERLNAYQNQMMESLPEVQRKNYEFSTPKTDDGSLALIVKRTQIKPN
jgi:hypothetical protein